MFWELELYCYDYDWEETYYYYSRTEEEAEALKEILHGNFRNTKHDIFIQKVTFEKMKQNMTVSEFEEMFGIEIKNPNPHMY